MALALFEDVSMQEPMTNDHLDEKWELLELLVGDKTHEHDRTASRHVLVDEKPKRKRMYDSINRDLNGMFVGEYAFFMNYGYAPIVGTPMTSPVILDKRAYDRHSKQLVLEVIGEESVQDRHLMDVGCGRGGVAEALDEIGHRPKTYVGVDLSSEAITFCNQAHDFTWARFAEGDAENLPAEDESLDLVINIESSNCYPNIDIFFREVWRVLRPGGAFLYTDLYPLDELRANCERLKSLGFVFERDIDITPNVLRACEETGARRLRAYPEGPKRDYMANFLAAPGSKLYEKMASGDVIYQLFRLRKP